VSALSYNEQMVQTVEALKDPQVGDRFHENVQLLDVRPGSNTRNRYLYLSLATMHISR
jgi:hypothetical protein